jgi:DNA-binding NtrC family response regulator
VKLLIIDDAEAWLDKMRAPFNGAVGVRTARSLDEARRLIRAESPEVIVLDAVIPDAPDSNPRFNVQKVLAEIKNGYGEGARPDVILVSGNDSVARSFDEVIGWLEGGQICDVLPKSAADTGWGVFQAILKHKVGALLKERALRPTLESALTFLNGAGIITRAECMKPLGEYLPRVSRSSATVLVVGESGTGKELVANALHKKSRRPGKLVVVNCAVGPSELLESQLFGYVRGAFTGANENRDGYFKAADGGTLFLDEVADMSPVMQAKLLRVLQEREITPVGDTKPVKVDVRVVTATNKTLECEVERGRFRADLYYRLAVITLKVPPLRDRAEDIELLAEHFTERFIAEHGAASQGAEKVSLGADVREAFRRYGWPGNVRELEHAVEAIVVSCSGEVTLDKLKGLGLSDTLRRVAASSPAPSEEGKEEEQDEEDELLSQLGQPEVRRWSDLGETDVKPILEFLQGRIHLPDNESEETDPAPYHRYKTILYLLLHPDREVTIPTVRRVTGLSEGQANKVIKSLLKEGLVEVDRTGKPFRYTLAARR